MSLCSESGNVESLVRVDREAVLVSCYRQIQRIKRARERLKDRHVRDIFREQVYWWRRVWRWFGFPKPTRVKSEKVFWADRDSWLALCLHGNQEDTCERLIEAAKATKSDHMWLSAYAIQQCNYQKPKETTNESKESGSDSGPISDYAI
jgi:hypothetical protein